MASTTILRALVSFTFEGPSGPVFVRKGSTYHRDSARLQGLSAEALETNFAPFEPDFGKDGDVEQATAAPGEKRRGGPKRTKKVEESEEKQATAAPGENEGDKPETAEAEAPAESEK